MVKEIPLQNGMVALVDDEDYERAGNYNWIYHKNGKNTLNIHTRLTQRTRSSTRTIKLSRFISNLEYGDRRIVQHKNGDYLDCRKENLVIKTRKEMSSVPRKYYEATQLTDVKSYKPRRKPKIGSSDYRGVSKDEYNHFNARIISMVKINFVIHIFITQITNLSISLS